MDAVELEKEIAIEPC